LFKAINGYGCGYLLYSWKIDWIISIRFKKLSVKKIKILTLLRYLNLNPIKRSKKIIPGSVRKQREEIEPNVHEIQKPYEEFSEFLKPYVHRGYELI